MKKSLVLLMAGVCMSALLAGGCANKDVKKEESLVPVVKKDDSAKVVVPVTQDAPANQVVPAQTAGATTADPGISVANSKFETVYFDFDKADLGQGARAALSKNAETISKSFKGANVQIEGHCDERGSAEYNLALGENRAKSAQKYLITLGVKAANLSIISYGKEKPAANGSDEAAWAKNRRAEFAVAK